MIAPTAPTTPNALRLLLWLKWTLLLRAYSRQRLRIAGLLILILIFAPLSIGAAVMCYLFGNDSPALPPIITRAVLGIAYIIWLITPLLGFPLNESYDPSRLFSYPVRLRTILGASVIGGLFEPSTLLALPVFVALILLYCTSIGSALVAAAAILLFLFHAIATAQLIMLSLIGFLRSRRFRDITIVLFPLIAMSYYVAQQAFTRGVISVNPHDLVNWRLWRIADWLPPGWASSSARLARDGRYGPALLYLGALAIAAVVPVSLAASVLRNLYMGDRGPIVTRPLPSVVAPREPDVAARHVTDRRAHREIAALARKEGIYLVREPQYKALAVNTLYSLVVLFFAFGMRYNSGGSANVLPPDSGAFAVGDVSVLAMALHLIRALMLPTFLLLASLPLVFNIFGGDASAITVLLSFPTPRLQLILAKNAAYAPVVFGFSLLGVLGGVLLMHEIRMVWLELLWVVLTVPVVVGAGNLVSVRLPSKMIIRGQRWGKGGQVSFGGMGGCGYALLQMACYLAALLTLIPVAAALIAPILLGTYYLLPVTIALAVVYSGALYWGATNFAAQLMQRRESEIVSVLAPDE